MLTRLIFIAAALSLGGCSLEWSRFAPPGIVKYEDIAGEKPMNPVIEQEIAERVTDKEAKFPKLAETPAAGAAPEKRPQAEIDAELAEIEQAVGELDANVAADRDAASALDDPETMTRRRDELVLEVEKDAAAVQRDREKLKSETNQ